ncbi:type II 3-dehydroquinate dehydratase [candidate division KSB1 bacterium]|nr:type II 3-dehydroquinate dehydratase [candidate division KSB1 bacterium]
MKNLLIVHGPNLNLLGEREPEVYGKESLKELNESIDDFAEKMGLRVKCFQSNHEGALIDFIHEQRNWAHGIVINPGALTHYSYALRDSIAAVNLPSIEVHLSDVNQREEFRKSSVIKDVCEKQITGLGKEGYLRAVEYLVGLGVLDKLQESNRSSANLDEALRAVVKLLEESFPKYTWVGIYLVEGDELVLHNYIGKPSPHTRIPIGQGICGAAVQEKQSIIIDDVNSDPRYLACSVETRSEIVVPILSGSKTFGEIDIDSDLEAIFHEGDQEILEKCASILAKLF